MPSSSKTPMGSFHLTSSPPCWYKEEKGLWGIWLKIWPIICYCFVLQHRRFITRLKTIYSYFNLRYRIKASSVRDIHQAAATSSTWNPNISFIQMARHRRSSLYGRGIVNFADSYSLRSHIPLRSSLVGLRLWSDNVNWNSCIQREITSLQRKMVLLVRQAF